MSPAPRPSDDSSLRQKAVTGAFWSLAETWGARLMTTGVFVILARQLEVRAFGLVALSIVFVDFGNRVVNQGFGASIVQREELDADHLDTAFWISVTTGAILAAAFALAAPALESLLDAPGLAPVLQVLSLRYVFDALSSAQQSILQRELRFRSLAIRRLTATLLSGIVAVVLALSDAGVWSLVAQILVQQAVGVVILWTASSWRPGRQASRTAFREMFGFSASVVGIAVLRFFEREGEQLIIGGAISASALGIYTVGRRFPMIANDVFSRTLGRVSFPVFSRIQSDRARQLRALHKTTLATSFFASPVFLALALFAPEVIELMLGDKWSQAVPFLRVFAVLGFLQVQSAFMTDILMSTGRAAALLRLRLVLTALRLTSVVIGVQWGINGVAVATLVSHLAAIVVTQLEVTRATQISAREFYRPLFPPSLSALGAVAVMSVVRFWIDGPALTNLVVAGAVGAVCYLAGVRLTAPSLMSELLEFVPFHRVPLMKRWAKPPATAPRRSALTPEPGESTTTTEITGTTEESSS